MYPLLHRRVFRAAGRYTRRWLETLSRRNLVPEKWLKEVLANAFINSPPVEKNASIVSRLEQEQRELEAFESMGCDVESLDDGEKVRKKERGEVSRSTERATERKQRSRRFVRGATQDRQVYFHVCVVQYEHAAIFCFSLPRLT